MTPILASRLLFWNRDATRDGPWKLIVQQGRLRLFNLHDDLGATRDLAALQPERAQRMRAQLEQLDQQTGFENGGRVLAPQFADWENLDLRVPADSPVLKLGCYPQGKVPGVRLS